MGDSNLELVGKKSLRNEAPKRLARHTEWRGNDAQDPEHNAAQ